MQVSDKETRAVFLNFKELRCLEKNVQALDLEKAYSISLITLDQKVVKVREKKMRDRVTKIKSHLSMDEIDSMKKLEEEGKLEMPESSSKLDSNLRIAAAAKRLKLLPRSKSAVPRLNDGMNDRRTRRFPKSPIGGNRPKSVVPSLNVPDANMPDFPLPRSVRTERRNSIDVRYLQENGIETNRLHKPKIAFEINTVSPPETPKNIDAGNIPPKTPRSSRLDDNEVKTDAFYLQLPDETYPGAPPTPSTPTQKTTVNHKVRPVSVPATQVTDFKKEGKQRRPSTTIPRAQEARKKSIADIRRASRMIADGKTRMPFSSHEVKEKKSALDQPYRSIRDGAMSSIDLDAKDNDSGNEFFKQIKQGLLLGEMATSLFIEDKIDNFFEDIDTYKDNNPAYVPNIKPVIDKGKAKKTKPKRNENRRRQLEYRINDIDARKRLAEDKTNMGKGRYLRVGDDRLDTSGVNTLAIDQMKMIKSLR